jgi:hypothetical protein
MCWGKRDLGGAPHVADSPDMRLSWSKFQQQVGNASGDGRCGSTQYICNLVQYIYIY